MSHFVVIIIYSRVYVLEWIVQIYMFSATFATVCAEFFSFPLFLSSDCRLYLTLITEGAEIKSADVIQTKHLFNVKDFQDEYPDSRCVVVSRNKMSRRQGNFEILYISNFLQKMWNGELLLIITKSKSDSTAEAL